MNSPPPIAARLDSVKQQIAAACDRFGRDPASVNLLAVSKTKPDVMVSEAMAAGQRDFGENYLQEALAKIDSVGAGATWHFIGAIQSNKTRPIAQHFDWVHTLASAKHARRLHEARPAHAPPLKVLIQVNISNEDSKSGMAEHDVRGLAESIAGFERLELRGLMAIPRIEETFDAQRSHFRRLANLRASLARDLGDALGKFDDLSMGMTADLEAAIAEGSTWLRIGTAIFGPRNQRD